jgi:hypothetical protein
MTIFSVTFVHFFNLIRVGAKGCGGSLIFDESVWVLILTIFHLWLATRPITHGQRQNGQFETVFEHFLPYLTCYQYFAWLPGEAIKRHQLGLKKL